MTYKVSNKNDVFREMKYIIPSFRVFGHVTKTIHFRTGLSLLLSDLSVTHIYRPVSRLNLRKYYEMIEFNGLFTVWTNFEQSTDINSWPYCQRSLMHPPASISLFSITEF